MRLPATTGTRSARTLRSRRTRTATRILGRPVAAHQLRGAAPLHLRHARQPEHPAALRHVRATASTTTTTASPTTAAPAARSRWTAVRDLNGDGEPDGDGPEPKRGKLIDFFIDMKADLIVDLAEYDIRLEGGGLRRECERAADLHAQCLDAARRRSPPRTRRTPAATICLLDPIDAAEDVTIFNLIVEPYIQALDRRHRHAASALERPRARQHEGALRPGHASRRAELRLPQQGRRRVRSG